MGLDQYARTFTSGDIKIKIGKKKIILKEDTRQIDFKIPDNSKELFSWRKHPGIQGWMENLYIKKGGEQEFNCNAVRLTFDDICQLEKDIKSNNLPETKGFFFGEDDGTEIQEDLRFCYLAKQELKKSNIVAYSSWW